MPYYRIESNNYAHEETNDLNPNKLFYNENGELFMMKADGTFMPVGAQELAATAEVVTIQGAPGRDGAQGPQGIPGESGKDGKDGADGAPGPKGDKGDTGEKGDKGDKGDTGAQGIQGLKGDRGDQGVPGKDGEPGLPGKDGSNGRDGSPGLQGVVGPAGKDGAPGAKGDKGDPGTPGKDGAMGVPGKDGTNGKDGAQGIQGLPGKDGAQGLKGDKGDAGTPGPMNVVTALCPQVNNFNTVGGTVGSVTITTTGGPVMVIATGDANPLAVNSWCILQLYRGTTAVGGKVQAEAVGSNQNVPYTVQVVDTVPAGTYTYNLKVNALVNSFQFGEASGPTLTAIEMTGAMGPQGPTSSNQSNQKIILNAVAPAASLTGVDVPQWSASYTGSGGQLLVRADITAWTGGNATKNYYLKKNGVVVATGNFFFNASNTHMTMPPIHYVDTTGAGANTWSIALGPGLNADVCDWATITVTETVGTSNVTITKAAAFVDAGTFVTLDNLKFSVTTSGQRGLCCATVSGTSQLAISASYAMAGGANGSATTWSSNPTYTTTPSSSWFGWSFPNAGDGSTYNIQDVTNQRFYRVTLMIGPGYTKNFIGIERLY